MPARRGPRQPLELDPARAPLAGISPALAVELRSLRGRVEAAGEASFARGEPALALDLALSDLSFRTADADVSGLNGRIRLEGLPLATPADQLVTIARADAGFPLEGILVRGRLRPDGALEIADAVWSALGGVMRTSGVVEPAATRHELVLHVQGLDVSELLSSQRPHVAPGSGGDRAAAARSPDPSAALKGRRSVPLRPTPFLLAVAGALAACARVQLEAPKEPIVINLNVKTEQEVRVKVDRDLEHLLDNEDLFGSETETR